MILFCQLLELALKFLDLRIFGPLHLIQSSLSGALPVYHAACHGALAGLPAGPPRRRLQVRASRPGQHGGLVNQIKILLDPLDPDHIILQQEVRGRDDYLGILLLVYRVDDLIVHEAGGTLALPEFTQLFLQLVDLLLVESNPLKVLALLFPELKWGIIIKSLPVSRSERVRPLFGSWSAGAAGS